MFAKSQVKEKITGARSLSNGIQFRLPTRGICISAYPFQAIGNKSKDKWTDNPTPVPAAKYWVDLMAADADIKIQDRRDELFDMELEKFVNGIKGQQGVENSAITWMRV